MKVVEELISSSDVLDSIMFALFPHVVIFSSRNFQFPLIDMYTTNRYNLLIQQNIEIW